MKAKNSNATEKKLAAKAYVESQFNVLRKHGSDVSVSSKKFKEIVRQVARASTA